MEELNKKAKNDNPFHKIGHELGPHVASMHVFHYDPSKGEKSPTPTGHVGYDVHYHEKNADHVSAALDRVGKHGDVAEDYDIGGNHRHAYGYVTPHGAKNSKISKNELIKSLSDMGHNQSAILLKNWNELDEVSSALITSLEKAVREPEYGSASAYENPPDVEGAGKQAKYRTGDPRHADGVRGDYTRAGIKREFTHVDDRKRTTTSGTSELRENTPHSISHARPHTWDKQGKKVPWHW